MRALWNKLDPKLKGQLVTALATYALMKLAIPIDPTLEGLIAIAAGAIGGYVPENAGTLLKGSVGVAPLTKEGLTSRDAADSGGLVVPVGVDLAGTVPLERDADAPPP